jgi:hypothetical protein
MADVRTKSKPSVMQYLCHYAVFDNLLKIRNLRAAGETKMKATLSNEGNTVKFRQPASNYF